MKSEITVIHKEPLGDEFSVRRRTAVDFEVVPEAIRELEAQLKAVRGAYDRTSQDLHDRGLEAVTLREERDRQKVEIADLRKENERLKTMLEVRTIEVANLEKEADALIQSRQLKGDK